MWRTCLHHINAARVFLDDGHRSARSLQQRREFGLDKTTLLVWIADVSERWSHVERAADLAFGQHIVTTQVDQRRFTGGVQLFKMTVAEFSLRVLLVTDRLRVGDSLRHRCRGGSNGCLVARAGF